ncbi:MAG TPA: anti-sigma factor [Bryobacteraceae bacterium]|nr:anti-sigma factor [Bryobacteraceae bacterium]
MSCKEIRVFMDGYLDRELDLVRSIDLERHLHDCSECAALHQARMAVRAAMGAGTLRYAAGERLKKNVRAALAERDREERKAQRHGFQIPWTAIAAAAAAFVVAAALWMRPGANPVENDVVASHIRSLMANHLMDVPSTDQHTVKPWFAGKLDFAPPVKDLAADGFPLVGGRLDYIGNHAAAAIVYRRNQHIINVFLWPGTHEGRIRAAGGQGYNVIQTVSNGMQYWVVSDLNRQELQQFTERLLAP